MAVKDKDLKRIIDGCKKGKPEHQKELYDRFSSFMFSVCNRYARNYTDAEDVFQEGFLKVFTNINQLRNEAALVWWMKKIFINEALMFYKKQPDLYRIDTVSIEGEPMIENENETIFSRMSIEELTGLIQELPNRMRLVFNMFVIEGFSHQEISGILSISVGTSKSHLHDARKLLRARISQLVKKKNYG